MTLEEHKVHHNQLGLTSDLSNYDSHIADNTIHFTVSSISHNDIQEIGTRTHSEIDTALDAAAAHISDASIHFTEASIDHGSIDGLDDDDHEQYALLLGRSGGQTLIGGTAANNNLTLQSTSNLSKGKILFGTSAYDEEDNLLGIGTDTPELSLHVIAEEAIVAAFEEVTAVTSSRGGVIQIRRQSTGNMADGFGTGINFTIEDNAAVLNTLGSIDMVRSGADNSGSFLFRTNNAGTISEKMRITNAGLVGVNTAGATPSYAFHLVTGSEYGFVQDNGTVQVGTYAGTAGLFGTKSNHRLGFFTNNVSEQMTLTTGGTFGLGTTAPNGLGQFHGTAEYLYVSSSTDSHHGFGVKPALNGTTKARLYVSGGNNNHGGHLELLNGDGDATIADITMRNAAADAIVYIQTAGDSWFRGGDTGFGHDAPSNTLDVRRAAGANYVAGFLNSTSSTGSNSQGIYIQCGNSHIQGAGSTGNNRWMELWSQSNAMSYVQYVTTTPFAQFAAASDERLKKNIQPTKLDGLDIINRIGLVEFDWKEGDVHQDIGYIAQQVKDIYPPMVSEGTICKTPPAERGKKLKKGELLEEEECLLVGDSVLVAVLVKAVQQLTAELLDTKGRLDKLEKK